MGTASFCGGVRHKRYSVQQEDWFLKTPMILLLKKTPLTHSIARISTIASAELLRQFAKARVHAVPSSTKSPGFEVVNFNFQPLSEKISSNDTNCIAKTGFMQ